MDMLNRSINNAKQNWAYEPVFSFTVDVDWASEDAIEYCYKFFEAYQIPVTFFLTHKSNFLLQKLKEGKIAAGIHPNFILGSSHGDSLDEVIDYCMNIFPKPECFRCHRYYDVNDISETFYNSGIRYDSNLCTFLQKVDPFIHRSGLIRFPVYFEDGAYLLHRQNLNFDEVKTELFFQNGLMIINIHPMHMVLNSPDFQYARKIKDSISRKEWNTLVKNDFNIISYQGKGIRDFVIKLLDYVKESNLKTYTLKELYEMITCVRNN